jgi:predicted secreted protein
MSGKSSYTQALTRPNHLQRRWAGMAAAVALCATTLLGGCAGDNLFSGPNAKLTQVPPVVTGIEAPFAIPEGGRLDVRVTAFAPVGISKIDVRFSRAVTGEQSFTIDSRADTASATAVLQIPAEALDSVLVIYATATDKLGRVSEVLSRTVRISDTSAPVVTAVLNPSRVSMGDTVRISVTASDNAGLRSIGYAILSLGGDTVSAAAGVTVSGISAQNTFVVALPAGLKPAELRVVGTAVNVAQLRGYSAQMLLTVVDLTPPSVRILSPLPGESHPLSDSLFVRVQVADSNGLAEVRLRGVAIRRDSLQNTTVVTRYLEKVVPLPGPVGSTPRDTTIVRYLLPDPSNVSEAVFIVAEARDVAGNIGVDTVRIVDGPRVRIMNPASGSSVGWNHALPVNITAVDRVAGLDSLKIVITGVRSETITLRNLGGVESIDTTVHVNTGPNLGTMSLLPRVWNRSGTSGSGPVVTLTVTSVDMVDAVAPLVSRRVTSAQRLELTDSIRVTVRATDGAGSGIRRMGAVIVAVSDDLTLPRQELYRTSLVFDPPMTGTPERVFSFALAEVYSELQAIFPRTFALQVHAFAIDAANNCGASVSEELTRLACEAVGSGGQFQKAVGAAPEQMQVTVVKGRSVQLPDGGRIADVVADDARRRIYLSNIQNNRVEIFHLDAARFATAEANPRRGRVGAAPWGLAMSTDSTLLYVANSGGNNISVLRLTGGEQEYGVEIDNLRIATSGVVLNDVKVTTTTSGDIRVTLTNAGIFSDRPQFIAQHRDGMILYSTLPTSAARPGTLRYVDTNRQSYLLLPGGGIKEAENSFAIAYHDSIKVVPRYGAVDSVLIWDRHPLSGVPLQAGPLPLLEALAALQALGSDVEWQFGTWNTQVIGLSDTTYVAVAADQQTIAFGEGARSPYGRVFVWKGDLDPSGKPVLSNERQVSSLVANASERVFGVGLNADGTLGVARGASSTYFFNPGLQLQGEFRAGMAGGAGGAALHPGNANYGSGATPDGLAFSATAQHTIKIIDTWHFYERGEIHIRDRVVGPLRTMRPSAAENQGLSVMDPNYIVVKIIAVTEGSNVVIVDVRRKDLVQ